MISRSLQTVRRMREAWKFGLFFFRPSRQSNISTSCEKRFKYPLPTPNDLETKMGMGWTQVTGWSFYYHIKLYLKITLLCRLICRLFKVPYFSSFPRSRLWHVTQRSQDHCARLQKFLRSSRSTAKMAALSGKYNSKW